MEGDLENPKPPETGATTCRARCSDAEVQRCWRGVLAQLLQVLVVQMLMQVIGRHGNKLSNNAEQRAGVLPGGA